MPAVIDVASVFTFLFRRMRRMFCAMTGMCFGLRRVCDTRLNVLRVGSHRLGMNSLRHQMKRHLMVMAFVLVVFLVMVAHGRDLFYILHQFRV